MNPSFTQILSIELAKILLPLRRLEDPRLVLYDLGWNVPGNVNLTTDLTPLVNGINALKGQILYPRESQRREENFLEFLREINNIYQDTIRAFNGSIPSLGEELDRISGQLSGDFSRLPTELSIRLNDYLFFSYLENYQTKTFAILYFLGVLEKESDTVSGLPYRKIHWERISRIFSNQIANFNDAYQWDSNFNGEEFINRLYILTQAFLLPGGIYQQPDYLRTLLGRAADDNKELRIPLIQTGQYPNNWREIDLNVSPHPNGIFIYPQLEGSINLEFEISKNWELEINGQGSLNGLGLLISPRLSLGIYSFGDTSTSLPSAANFLTNFIFRRDFEEPTGYVIFGSEDGTHLAIKQLEFKILIEKQGDQTDFGLFISLKPISLKLNGSDGDSFIQSLIPSQLSGIDLDLDLGYTLKRGFVLDGNISFEIRFSLNKELGPLKILELILGLRFGNGGLGISLGNSLKFSLGPITGVFENLGLKSNLNFPSLENNNSWNLDVGFQAPNGIGIEIDAGLVTGGGFIRFEEDIGRYSGALHVEIFGYGVTAFGILSTKDSNNNDLPPPGYSFLIIISAQNLLIQLGFGFILDGVGGLIGIHRTFSMEVLEEGIREGILDSILFPSDPIENMPRIINDVDRVFPAQIDQFVFGPMVQIVWGKPIIFSIEAGILIEVPEPLRIIILGQLQSKLPTDDFTILELNVDVRGEINFDKQQIVVIASLRDCHLLLFKMKGSMAFLIDWGSTPDFLLSVGGYHPDFIPPPNFPVLDRMSISMSFLDVIRFNVEGYFAVSSNSIQFGGFATVFVGIDVANINGHLLFNALVVFNPFYFTFEFSQGFDVEVAGKSLFGFRITGRLSGPSPFRINGEGCISILFIDICIGFDLEFGDEDPTNIPTIDPWEELEAAIEDEESWKTILPSGLLLTESLRDSEIQLMELVHPMGLLEMRQKLLPLNLELEKYREFSIQGQKRFEIRQVLLGNRVLYYDQVNEEIDSVFELLYGPFAPGQFLKLKNHEKLQRNSFESMVSGFTVGSSVKQIDNSIIEERELKYEEKYIDNEPPANENPQPAVLIDSNRNNVLQTLNSNAKSYSRLFESGINKYRDREAVPRMLKRIALEEEEYVIALGLNIHPDEEIGGRVNPEDIISTPYPLTHNKARAFEILKNRIANHPEERAVIQAIPLRDFNAGL